VTYDSQPIQVNPDEDLRLAGVFSCHEHAIGHTGPPAALPQHQVGLATRHLNENQARPVCVVASQLLKSF
jgi:hypothetical protein